MGSGLASVTALGRVPVRVPAVLVREATARLGDCSCHRVAW